MRRVSASLLLALLTFGFALPLLLGQPNAIPACCRRDGKHHCAMSPKGAGFRSNATDCPYRSLGAVITPSTALKVSSSVLSISLYSQFHIHLTPTTIARRAFDNTQKRGPPLT
jgi:hypothetical protein